MAGVPDVKLEQYLGGSWVDLTSRVMAFDDYGAPMQITRGVGDAGDCQPGTFTLTLNNDDGALTPRKTSSAYYPNLVRYRPIRLRAYIDGAWRGRFTGYVDTESLHWGNSTDECSVDLTCTDALGLATELLRSVAVESTAARGPIAYYPLTDAESTAAADQSGNSRPELVLKQWKSKGEIGWASGEVLPTDNVGGLVLTPASDQGWMLQSQTGIDLPTSWCLTVFPTPAAKDGYVVQVGTDQYSIGLWYDTSLQKFKAIETLLDSSGDPVDYVLATSDATWSGGMESLTITPTTVKLGSAASAGSRHNSDRMLGSLVSVGGALAVESGRARMYSGEVKHLGIWSGSTLPSGLSSDTLTGPSALLTMSTAVSTLLTWSGITATVVTLGTDWPVSLAKTEGMTALDLLTNYAIGSLGRIFVDGDGQVTIAAFDYSPAAVVAPSAEIDPGVEWAADPEGEVRSATMTWPDGSAYTATSSSGSGTAELPGVLSTAQGRQVADWVVTARDGRPRFPAAPYDLLTLPSADALAKADIGMVLQVPGLPSQLPSTTETGVIDSLVETLGVAEWTRQFVTSVDTRERILIAGDATRGKVSSGYLAGPLGPEVAGGSWKAGEEVTHTLLNARQYAGVRMQAGQQSVTPTANAVTTTAVSFPTAFSAAPSVVVVTPNTSVPGDELLGWGVSSITASGFNLNTYRTTTTGFSVHWVAVE